MTGILNGEGGMQSSWPESFQKRAKASSNGESSRKRMRWKSLGENEQAKFWTEGIKSWLKEPLWPNRGYQSRIPREHGNLSQEYLLSNLEKENDLPIWVAAQQAVPRYEDFLSSAGSRGRLLRKLLVWMGLLPSEPPASIRLDRDGSSSEPYLRLKQLLLLFASFKLTKE
eukprot:Gb_17317 [translate_table: standard]